MKPELIRLITIAVTIVGAFILAGLVRYFLTKFLDQSSKYLKVDPTKYRFFKNAISFAIYTIAFIIVVYSIPPLKSLAMGLLAGAGILVAVVGFASQQAFANIVSGIFIVVSRPFRVDDIVKVGKDYMGVVEDITLRHTVIRDFENKRIIIPNAIINSETVTNASIEDKRIRRHIDIGISYDSDIDRAIHIIREEALKHPNCIDGRTPEEKETGVPQVVVRVIGFGDSSVNLKAWVWAETPGKAFEMHCDLNKSIKERFDAEGVEIPFPYRTIVYKKDISPSNMEGDSSDDE